MVREFEGCIEHRLALALVDPPDYGLNNEVHFESKIFSKAVSSIYVW